MGGVRTPIIGRPRPSSSQRRTDDLYTLNCEEPKNHIGNIQHGTPEQTYTAFTNYITSRTFDYNFEHLPTTHPNNDLV